MRASLEKSAPPVIRLGHPLAFCSFLRHVGAPVDRLLRRHGLPVLCEDPDALVPLARAWSFFESAARQEDLLLGWLVGAWIGDSNLNAALARKLTAEPTLLQALHRLVQLSSTEASHLRLGILERRDDVVICTHYPGRREAPGYMISQTYQIGVILGLIRHFLGRHWVPQEIGTEYSLAPTVTEELPGSRILIQREMGYIAVPRNRLHQPARPFISRDCGGELPPLTEGLDYANTLRAVLKAYLPQGYPSARFAATLMGTSKRTLLRRLSACGVTYGGLVDEVRFSVAKELLRDPDLRVAEIGRHVGFDDHSHFTRMFRRVCGLTPQQMRDVALDSDLGGTSAGSSS
jgi:AraC-like DNA-binding protein